MWRTHSVNLDGHTAGFLSRSGSGGLSWARYGPSANSSGRHAISEVCGDDLRRYFYGPFADEESIGQALGAIRVMGAVRCQRFSGGRSLQRLRRVAEQRSDLIAKSSLGFARVRRRLRASSRVHGLSGGRVDTAVPGNYLFEVFPGYPNVSSTVTSGLLPFRLRRNFAHDRLFPSLVSSQCCSGSASNVR